MNQPNPKYYDRVTPEGHPDEMPQDTGSKGDYMPDDEFIGGDSPEPAPAAAGQNFTTEK